MLIYQNENNISKFAGSCIAILIAVAGLDLVPHGTRVLVRCTEGMVSVSTRRATCTAGQWIPGEPSCGLRMPFKHSNYDIVLIYSECIFIRMHTYMNAYI